MSVKGAVLLQQTAHVLYFHPPSHCVPLRSLYPGTQLHRYDPSVSTHVFNVSLQIFGVTVHSLIFSLHVVFCQPGRHVQAPVDLSHMAVLSILHAQVCVQSMPYLPAVHSEI